MSESTNRSTLLVFTRGAECETRRRRLLPARLAALEVALHHRCLDSALAAGREAGCSIAVSSPVPLSAKTGVHHVPQEGVGIGHRLRTALARTRREAEGPVIVVGTDVPGLGCGHLRDAIARLEEDPQSVVLGPSPDGGFYLLATRQPLDEVLSGVSWHRPETLESLLGALARAGIRVSLLEPLLDLDRPQDLAYWASRTATSGLWHKIVALLRRALAALGRPAIPAVLGRPRTPEAVLPSGRAPPLAV